MPSDLVEFNRSFLISIHDAERAGLPDVHEFFHAKREAVKAIGKLDLSILQKVLENCPCCIATPMITLSNLEAALNGRQSPLNHSQKLLDIMQPLNYGYLMMIRHLANTDIAECVLRTNVSVDVAGMLKKLTMKKIQTISENSGQMMMECAYSKCMVESFGRVDPVLIPFLTLLGRVGNHGR